MNQREKRLILVGLVLIICAPVLIEWLESDDHQKPNSQALAGKSINNSMSPQAKFALNRAQSKRSVTLTNPRNIFAPLKEPTKPKVAKPPAPVIEKAPPIRLPTPKRLPPPPSPPPPPPPLQPTGPTPAELAAQEAKQQMKQYTFLGYLRKEGERQAFLSKGQALYVVKGGERFEGDLEMKSIAPTEVVLSKYVKQAGTTVEATLVLSKNRQGDL